MTPRFSLLQSEWWGRVRARQGWTVRSRSPLVLQRSIGPLRLAYAPHADSPVDAAGSTPEEMATRLRTAVSGRTHPGERPEDQPAGRMPHPHVLRWDVPWNRDGTDPAALHQAGFVPAPGRVQPPDTVVIDLTPEEDALLAAMKSKTRYNVRLAGKRGVVVTRHTGAAVLEHLDRWYALYRETAVRDRISIHPAAYYTTVVDTAVRMRAVGESAPAISLYLAEHEGDLLSGIITASWDGMTTYLYGASASHKRNLMANYLVQWRAIVDARGAGDWWYDMFGIPPTDDPAHPMHGLYRFKTGFGGTLIHRPGCWDLDIAVLPARAFRAAERLRGWYHYRLRKRQGAGR